VAKKIIPAERLAELDRKLLGLPRRSPERRHIIQDMAVFYDVSEKSLYRALRLHLRPKALRRSDHGAPRVLPREKMEHYCEIIAAVKVRTSNQKGRCLSTGETIRLLEEFGIETPEGLVKVDPGLLKLSTVNRYLLLWGFDKTTLTREPPAVFSSCCSYWWSASNPLWTSWIIQMNAEMNTAYSRKSEPNRTFQGECRGPPVSHRTAWYATHFEKKCTTRTTGLNKGKAKVKVRIIKNTRWTSTRGIRASPANWKDRRNNASSR
jgi:hypothetical protein